MLKNNLLPLFIISFFLISTKSMAVEHPEYINWRAHPREFVISLSEAIFGTISDDNTFIESAASRINTDPNSRLELFWLFLEAPKYRYSESAKQKKEYQVYYKYVTSSNIEKYSYYVSKQASGAHLSIQGMYTFGVAMSLRDFYATFVERSIEYGEMRNFVPRNLRSSSNSNVMNANSIPSGKCSLWNKEGSSLTLDANNDPDNQTQIICKYNYRGLLQQEIVELKLSGIKHGLYLEYAFDMLTDFKTQEELRNSHYLRLSGYYNNGKKVGVWKGYNQPDQLTGVQLEEGRTEYNNDVKLLEEHYYNVPSKQLRVRTKYNNGKPLEYTFFYKNGQMEWRTIYDLNGTKVSEEKWYENGRKK